MIDHLVRDLQVLCKADMLIGKIWLKTCWCAGLGSFSLQPRLACSGSAWRMSRVTTRCKARSEQSGRPLRSH